ncbi:MAG: type III secretion system export apparatus subunit SctU [Myxococcaceae bacterium]
MAEESGEKTEDATPQKLRKAREKGQVSKSQDLVSASIFLGCLASLAAALGWMAQKMTTLVLESIEAIHSPHLEKSVESILREGLWTWMLVSLPLIATAFIVALATNYFQVGFLLTFDPLIPKLSKINPISGIKQLFSVKRLVEVLKQIVKFTMVSMVVYYAFKEALPNLVNLQRLDLYVALEVVRVIIKDICLRVAVLFMIIAIADFFWQRHTFNKSMKMTKNEIKQEYKESEGDPQLKSERKHLAQELIMHGSQQAVKKADAVITNPTHIAVAIRYQAQEDSAPIVVAKGMDKNAEVIKKIAQQYKVPILQNIPLAQALHKLDLEEEVPEELYEAVAEVLNFVYEMRKKNG